LTRKKLGSIGKNRRLTRKMGLTHEKMHQLSDIEQGIMDVAGMLKDCDADD